MLGTSSEPAPRVLRGRYRLVRLLGRGGMGYVWMAEDMELERRVAIKMLSSVGESSARRRFVREAKVVASFRCTHTTQVFELGWEDEQPFIAMELLEGLDLEKKMSAGPLALDAVQAVIDGCSAALQEAHEAEVVHRDIKPANIFLARQGDKEVVKLLDFGIALRRSGTASLTGEGAIIGTPSYMSPEQSQGQKVDQQTDLWSLAVVAYEALTGHHPFDSPTDWETLAAIVKRPIPPPRSLRPDLPEALDDFFLRALRRDPERRFSDAATFRKAFTAAASGGATAPASAPTTRIMPVQPAMAASAEEQGTSMLAPPPLQPSRRRFGVVAAALAVVSLVGWGLGQGATESRWASSFGAMLSGLKAPVATSTSESPAGTTDASRPDDDLAASVPVPKAVAPPSPAASPLRRPTAAPKVVAEPVGRPRPVAPPPPAPADNEFGI